MHEQKCWVHLTSLKIEMGGDLHDHINKFNQLVSQLLNADDKLSDEEQALLLLAVRRGLLLDVDHSQV